MWDAEEMRATVIINNNNTFLWCAVFLIPDIEFFLDVTARVAIPLEVTVDTAEDPGIGDDVTQHSSELF